MLEFYVYPFGLLLIFCCFSCTSSTQVARLFSVEKELRKPTFSAPTQQNLPAGIQLDISFFESTPEYLIFDVRFQNYSPDPFLVNPIEFKLLPLPSENSFAPIPPMYAINPERKLLRLDLDESKAIASAKNEKVAGIVVTSLLVVSAAAAVVIAPNAGAADVFIDAGFISSDDTQYWIDRRLAASENDRVYWSDIALRKTHLPPMCEMTGTIVFPRNDQFQYLKITFNQDNWHYSEVYNQQLFNPTSN